MTRLDRLENWVYERLGDHDGFYTHPPGDRLRVRFDEDRIAKTSNDGFELWVGSHSQWYFHCRAPEARRLAAFILWDWWVIGTWCGLRRVIWYWLLSRRCSRYHPKQED